MIIFKPKNPPWLTGKSAKAGGKIRYSQWKKFRHCWWNNLRWSSEKSAMVGGKIIHLWQQFSL
jgi:hypothetical protein